MTVVEEAEERWGGCVCVWWSAGAGGVEYGEGDRERERVHKDNFSRAVIYIYI